MELTPPQAIALTESALPYAIAAFNGFMLSLFLLFKKANHNGQMANFVFAALLMVFSLMQLENAVDLGGYFFKFPYLIDAIAPFYGLIGPLLYLYIRLQTNPKPLSLNWKHFWHLTPFIMLFIYMLPMMLNDNYDAKLLWFYADWFPELTSNGADLTVNCESLLPWQWGTCHFIVHQAEGNPTFDLHLYSPIVFLWLYDLETVIISCSLIFYFSLAFKMLIQHRRRLKQITGDITNKDLSWLYGFMTFISFAVLIYLGASIQEMFFDTVWMHEDTRNEFIYLSIAASIIYVGIQALRQPDIFTKELKTSVEELRLPNSNDEEKYKNSPVTPELGSHLAAQIHAHLLEQKSYLDPQLSLAALSEQLALSSHILSQVINETMQTNFFELVNSYRLTQAKKRLKTNPQETILQAAIDSGFNSKTSFYSYFKKHEGITPSKWRVTQIADGHQLKH